MMIALLLKKILQGNKYSFYPQKIFCQNFLRQSKLTALKKYTHWQWYCYVIYADKLLGLKKAGSDENMLKIIGS